MLDPWTHNLGHTCSLSGSRSAAHKMQPASGASGDLIELSLVGKEGESRWCKAVLLSQLLSAIGCAFLWCESLNKSGDATGTVCHSFFLELSYSENQPVGC